MKCARVCPCARARRVRLHQPTRLLVCSCARRAHPCSYVHSARLPEYLDIGTHINQLAYHVGVSPVGGQMQRHLRIRTFAHETHSTLANMQRSHALYRSIHSTIPSQQNIVVGIGIHASAALFCHNLHLVVVISFGSFLSQFTPGCSHFVVRGHNLQGPALS